MAKASRQTVDLSGYPDMVVVYLGMRVNTLTGLKTMFGFGPKIENSVSAKPDGLLLHENLLWGLFPPHAGMRQYWRDFESLEAWTRSEPHRIWWTTFLKNSGGTGFWHESYSRHGGFEAIYGHMEVPVGMMKFAPVKEARGPMFSARARAGMKGEAQSPVPEGDLYGS